MSNPDQDPFLNVISVPQGHRINHRILGFYREIGFTAVPLGMDSRDISVAPVNFEGEQNASISYVGMESIDYGEHNGWTLRPSNSSALRSSWNQGAGRASLTPAPDARIVLPKLRDIELVRARGGELLAAHTIGGVEFGEDDQLQFDFVDPFFHRIRVSEAEA